MAMRGKFTLRASALSKHTENFNKILEQVPAPKIENIELIKPAEIKPTESIAQKIQEQENQAKDEVFVFGEQLTDRVINADKAENETSAADDTPKEDTESKPTNLWTGHAETEDKFDNDMYTILRMNCKLFVLESDKANWVERGYGVLKLVDTPDGSNCKIMMWTDKIFRLILNTKLFDKMQIDRANKKSIRFNAFDNGTIRIFLIKTANPNDCEELYDLLQMRLSEYTSKLSSSQTSETSRSNKNVVFKCDCNLNKENEQESSLASLELYSYTDETQASRSHQLFLDIITNETDQKLILSTYLKLIKITKQISKTNEFFEFEIDEYSYSADPTTNKIKYKISIGDKEKENQIMELYRKEPKIRMDDSSNGGFLEDDTQEDQETSYNEESNDANRKSDSINESDRSNSSASCTEEEQDATGNEKPNVFDQETGESKRKRKSESDDSESEIASKKQEIDQNVSLKRSAEDDDEEVPNEKVEDGDSSKKTKVGHEKS
ncbi:unnamed protein product [Brachionus calyciflorus]|uniref:RanBD1 domain-containing protein n=1 Tax=Brachionus calyciflorus TaxID=104777 RepID=A0A813RN75_9BILA|nr:unnamed protein product [Brachionus calyciflorus]